MNFTTPFQLDSIMLPAWAENAIRHTRQAAAQSHKVIKAFNKTITPVIGATAKGLSHYYWLCFQGAEQWTLNRQPISSSVRTVHTKLTSPESIATCRRIGYVSRETATTALIIGLCGVVSISVGIEQAQKGYALAQKGYEVAQKLYGKVYARLNPSEPQPELLPSCEMALASTELAEALDNFASVVEADVKAKAEAEVQVQYRLESMKQEQVETLPVVQTSSMFGQLWNPEPRNIHQEVLKLLIQQMPLMHSPEPEPVAQAAPEPQPEQKPVRKSRSSTKLTDQAKANPQQKQKGQRKPKAKDETGVNAGGS